MLYDDTKNVDDKNKKILCRRQRLLFYFRIYVYDS